MELYHITNQNYEIGQHISIEEFEGDSTYYYRNKTNYNWIDDFLSDSRPENIPNRKKALFAFSSISHCKGFNRKALNLYKVEMDTDMGYPMYLAGLLDSFKSNDFIKNAIRKEYWYPNLNWKVKEFISSNMTILEKVKNNIICDCLTDYLHDRDLSKNFIKSIEAQ